jgi:hypothetical protein
MNRLLFAGMAFAIGLGGAAAADAQLYPPFPGSTQSVYDLYPMPPSSPLDTMRLDTTRRDVVADPGCGAANPQGGLPSAVTWGSCP